MLKLIIVSLVWYSFCELKQRMLNIFTYMEHFYMSFGTGVTNFYKQSVFWPTIYYYYIYNTNIGTAAFLLTTGHRRPYSLPDAYRISLNDT